MDNTLIRSSFYTVYSQADISDVSSSRKRSLRLVETAEIQASLQLVPSFFPPGGGQPRSQGLSSSRPSGKMTDPGNEVGWRMAIAAVTVI